eukprot:11176602-Lingulodinium_polyedra.AAC.1
MTSQISSRTESWFPEKLSSTCKSPSLHTTCHSQATVSRRSAGSPNADHNLQPCPGGGNVPAGAKCSLWPSQMG